ncbi:MAG: hypothetical protein HS113_29100 [Verrucomicrobiales bacterium]|nr:hypothetical protein [Verrucomicrobiales bacterium]
MKPHPLHDARHEDPPVPGPAHQTCQTNPATRSACDDRQTNASSSFNVFHVVRGPRLPLLPSLAFAVCLLISPVVFPAESVVITSNLTISETDTTYDGADLVISGGIAVAINGAHSFSSLALNNGAILTHSACTVTETHRLDLTVANAVVVSANSKIDVSGKGYAAGRTVGNTTAGASGRSGAVMGWVGAAKGAPTRSMGITPIRTTGAAVGRRVRGAVGCGWWRGVWS